MSDETLAPALPKTKTVYTRVANLTNAPLYMEWNRQTSEETEWAPAGDPLGGDVQEIAEEYTKNARLKTTIDRQYLAWVDDDGNLVPHIPSRAAQAWISRTAENEQKRLDSLRIVENYGSDDD